MSCKKNNNEKINTDQMKNIQAGAEKGKKGGNGLNCNMAQPNCCKKTECCP